MEKKQFSIDINASPEKVWDILWDDSTYRSWTSVFSEGSYAETDWKEGSKVLFLNSKGDGMYSVIDKKVPNAFMSFRHLGVIKDNKEAPIDEETKKWSGAVENYTLKENEGNTSLTVDIDVSEEYGDYFADHFPKALNKVKELSENH